MKRRVRSLSQLLIAVALTLAPAVAGAQMTPAWDGGRVQLSRTELEGLLGRLTEMVQSPAYSAEFRARARDQAALIRTRLQSGDFQVGDQIVLLVEREPTLTDTFTVRPGRMLTLPQVGDIPLAGVLRAELEGHLSRQLSRFLLDPVVHARSLIRITMIGQVGRPGFYVVPAELLMSDLIMTAGGPAAGADITHLSVRREGRTIWGGAELQKAIAEGRTIDELSLRAGDEVYIPVHGQGIAGRVLQASLATLSGVALLLTALAQMSR